MSDRLPLAWRPVEPPPPPDGLVAEGAVASALAARLLAEPADWLTRSGLSGVASRGLLVVLGPTGALPWVDGLCYLARVSDTPGLYVPTWTTTTHPPSLVASALAHTYGDGPHVLLPAGAASPTPRARVLSVAEARPLARDTLARWLEAQGRACAAEGSP